MNNECQENIKKELRDILELETKKYLVLYEINNNEELKAKVIDLLPKIKEHFLVKKVKSFMFPEQAKKLHMSIIRYLMCIDYEICSVEHVIKKDNIGDTGGIIKTTKYSFSPRVKNN